MRYLFLILALIVFWIGFGYLSDWERKEIGIRRTKARLDITRHQLNHISKHLRDHYEETGRYPSNYQGLQAVDGLAEFWQGQVRLYDYRRFSTTQNVEISSLWGEPFIYENHRGIDAGAFADSGAMIDFKRAYSIKVDEGIYVWSVAAQQNHHEYLAGLRVVLAWAGLLVLLCVVLFGFYVVWTIRSVGSGYTGWRRARRILWSLCGGGAISLLVCLVAFPLASGGTCYAWSLTRRRTPELTRDYLSVMEKYHERGVISDNAYRKIVEAMKEEESR